MKKLIILLLSATALQGCVSVYEAVPRDEPETSCRCGRGDDRIYRIKNGRWYRLREGICPCVDRP
jgi:hypothetical protein